MLQFTGKTMALDLLANGTAYGVGKAGEELGLPLPVTLLLSLGAGVTVSLKAGKYIFKDSAGNVVLEAGEQEVKALKESRVPNIDGSSTLRKGTEGGRYSEFADGMSATDRARYIQNNETKFFEEFSERARESGLNDVQIAVSFDAMQAGDYERMASYFDTSSPIDGVVFWSGNKEGAAAYADEIGGTIMEQTPGGQVFDGWRGLQGMYPEWNTGTMQDQKLIWEALSSQYASGQRDM